MRATRSSPILEELLERVVEDSLDIVDPDGVVGVAAELLGVLVAELLPMVEPLFGEVTTP